MRQQDRGILSKSHLWKCAVLWLLTQGKEDWLKETIMNTPTPETDDATPASQQSISEEAAAIVAGERQADYGDANESFARIANLWSAYTGSTIEPWDVAQMMILLKVSRAKTSKKRDTLVDIIGYAECAGRLKK
jgi:hypothetical protein